MMNSAALSAGSSPVDAVRASGIPGWAMRTGRALERWGRTRAAHRHDREHLTRRLAAASAAAAARSERDALVRSATFQLW